MASTCSARCVSFFIHAVDVAHFRGDATRRVHPKEVQMEMEDGAARYCGGQSLKGCVSPKWNWKRWMTMKVSMGMPEIAKFNLPEATV